MKRRVVKVSRNLLCSVDGCKRFAMIKSLRLCPNHYRKFLRHGTTDGSPRRNREECSVPDCERMSSWMGLCGMHSQRKKRLGSEFAEVTKYKVRVTGDWRTETPKYSTVHRRLERHRGPARQHICENCHQRQAEEWALSPTATDVLIGPAHNPKYQCRYTTNLDQYLALCAGCHRRMDAEFRESA